MREQKLVVTLLLAAALIGCDAADETQSAPAPQPEIAGDAGRQSAPEAVAATPTSPAMEGDHTVVMLGDSLTAGFGLPVANALPARIQDSLDAAGLDVTVVNAGVSGDTTAGGLARYDWSVASANPDLLIIALGANDYLSGLDPQRARQNLAAIIERAQGDGVQVLLASVTPRSSAAADIRATEFAAIYPELAERYGVEHFEGLLEGVRDNPDLLLSDGLHPTAEGVDRITDRLAPVISELIGAPPR
ncbi:MAG: arylesterase [Pseudomonadota bacterium]